MASLQSGGIVTAARRSKLISHDELFIRRAALTGFGVAFLPSWGVADDLKGESLEPSLLEDPDMIISPEREIVSVLALRP